VGIVVRNGDGKREIGMVTSSYHYSVLDNGVIRKLAAYVILVINTDGKKEVLSINVGDNESSKYWMSV
jgi:transposase-like protein